MNLVFRKVKKYIIVIIFRALITVLFSVYHLLKKESEMKKFFDVKELFMFIKNDSVTAQGLIGILDAVKSNLEGKEFRYNFKRKIPALIANAVGAGFDYVDLVKDRIDEQKRNEIESAALTDDKEEKIGALQRNSAKEPNSGKDKDEITLKEVDDVKKA